MKITEIEKLLSSELSPLRMLHSLGVMKVAIELSETYKEDKDKIALAGLLHDCARNIKAPEIFLLCQHYGINVDPISKNYPELLHGPLGACIAREKYGIQDEEILQAIACHTTGKENMSRMEKIIFLADYIEQERSFLGVEEMRKWAYIDIDKTMILALNNTIRYLLNKGVQIHPDTINTRNNIIAYYNENNGITNPIRN